MIESSADIVEYCSANLMAFDNSKIRIICLPFIRISPLQIFQPRIIYTKFS